MTRPINPTIFLLKCAPRLRTVNFVAKTAVCILVLGLLTQIGCTRIEFQNSLVSPDEAELPPELMGHYWAQSENNASTMMVHIVAAGDQFPDGFVSVICVGKRDDEAASWGAHEFIGFLTRIGDTYYFQWPAAKDEDASARSSWPGAWDSKRIDYFGILRVKRNANGHLMIDGVDPKSLAEHVEAGRLAGTIERRAKSADQEDAESGQDLIHVTSSSEELTEFLRSDAADSLFATEGIKLRRFDLPLESKGFSQGIPSSKK